jgi:hypothetical protein
MNAGKPILLLSLLFSSPAWCDERVDSIRAAAAEIRAVRDAQGMAAAHEAVLACYAKKAAYETCIAQDFIVSNVAAREARDPMGVLEEMAERITQAMQRSAVPLADAKQYILLVKQHGFAAYLQ